jgi:hypothetical protein
MVAKPLTAHNNRVGKTITQTLMQRRCPDQNGSNQIYKQPVNDT